MLLEVWRNLLYPVNAVILSSSATTTMNYFFSVFSCFKTVKQNIQAHTDAVMRVHKHGRHTLDILWWTIQAFLILKIDSRIVWELVYFYCCHKIWNINCNKLTWRNQLLLILSSTVVHKILTYTLYPPYVLQRRGVLEWEQRTLFGHQTILFSTIEPYSLRLPNHTIYNR
jgi:hypothetical protein